MNEVTAILEAVLFAAAEPLSLAVLAGATGYPEEDVSTGLDELGLRLANTGLRLSFHHGLYQLVTAPEAATSVKRYLQDQSRSDLSRAAIETLAMVAYRGPVTKSKLDELRGVSSDAMVRGLLQRGLIIEAGRADEAGRQVQYAVSHRFLHHFGLTDISQLPPLDEVAPQPPEANEA